MQGFLKQYAALPASSSSPMGSSATMPQRAHSGACRKSRLLSAGASVPSRIVTNRELENLIDTSDEWIRTRTGIAQRRICDPQSNIEACELGAQAAQKALDKAAMAPSRIDCVICSTFTPDRFFPSTACKIQGILGISSAFSFDISAACTGFLYGMQLADGLIASGKCSTVLLVAAEITSRAIDWTDRGTCVLFGDGAGAVVMGVDTENCAGVLSCDLTSDPRFSDILHLSARGSDPYMRMKGNEVFRHAVNSMASSAQRSIIEAGLTVRDIDLFIPHQANSRIITALASALKIPQERIFSNVARFGNTASASIPIALDEAWENGMVKPDQTILFCAAGGGLTAGSAVVRF